MCPQLFSYLYRIPKFRGETEVDSTPQYADLQYIRNKFAEKVGIW